MATFAEETQYAIDQAYRGLNPEERSVAGDTTWEIRPSPTPQDFALVGASPSDSMVGLFHQPGNFGTPTVTLFQQPIQDLNLPPWVVVEHELTHVLGYDHALREVQVSHGCGINRQSHLPGSRNDCPVCQIYRETAHGAALITDLNWAAQQQGQIPVGLGGTIPQARLSFLNAEALAEKAIPLLSDRPGEVRNLRSCLQHMVMALGEHLEPQDLPPLSQQAIDCRRTAYRAAWTVYSRHAFDELQKVA